MKFPNKLKLPTLVIARSGVIAALYVALTYAFQSVAFGIVQFRPSEALTMLPLLYGEGIPALFVGCALGNLTSPFGIADILIGSCTTLIAAVCTFFSRYIRPKWLKIGVASLFPILLNAFFLPLMWLLFFGDPAYWANVLSIFLCQLISVCVLGIPLYLLCDRLAQKGVAGFAPVQIKKSAAPQPSPATADDNR